MKLNSRHEYRTVDHAQGEERPKAKHRGPARCPPVSPGVAATSQHSAVTPSAPGRGRLAGRAAVPGAAAGTAPPTRPGAHLYLVSPLTRRTIRERAVAGGREAVEAEGGGRRGAPPPRGSRPAGAARRYVYPCVTPGRRSRTASAERAMASGVRGQPRAAGPQPVCGER